MCGPQCVRISWLLVEDTGMWVEVLVRGAYKYTAVNLLFKGANLRTYRNEMFEDVFKCHKAPTFIL